jgi:hypothetical protein
MPGAASSTAVGEAPRGRTALIAGGAVAVVLAAGIGLYLWQRTATPSPPPTTAPGPDFEAFKHQLVTEKLEVAHGRLAVKDYAGAQAKAQEILDELDAQNADALRIQQEVKGVLAQVEEAANTARAAVKRGDLETASKELERVMGIDPQHPVAKELSGQLDSRFRERAQEARQHMQRARAAADEVRASSHKAYAQAMGAAEEAERLVEKREFTLAVQKFLDSRNAFDRARQAALESQRPSPTPRPYVTPRPGPTATPYVAPSAATPTAPPPLPPTAAPPAVNIAAEEGAVRSVIDAYERAIETKDLGLYRRIKPTLSAGEERRLKTAFAAAQAHDVRITIEALAVDPGAGTATARLARNDTIGGKAIPPIKQTVSLVKRDGAWTIREIQ